MLKFSLSPIVVILFSVLSLFYYNCLSAQSEPLAKLNKPQHSVNSASNFPAYPPISVSKKNITIEGKVIPYEAIIGCIPILDNEENDTIANMSFTAYLKEGVNDKSKRAITFFYNGGPGSSTMWLHIGAFGPKRIETNLTEHLSGPPYKFSDNENCLLDISDLVFIDAPGTGYGRVLKGRESNFYGVDEDALAFGQFIHKFITQFNRWNSPRFLFGESYGTMRSAVLVNQLQTKFSIDVNGVIFLSQILDYNNSVYRVQGNQGNNRAYALSLPTYAATAWYHNKISKNSRDFKTFISEVEDFALSDYLLALNKGAKLDSINYERIAKSITNYTGLPSDFLKKGRLKIDGGQFTQNVLRNENLTTGRLDTRFFGPVLDPLGQRSDYDPAYSAVLGGYVSVLNDYLTRELGYNSIVSYRPSLPNSGVVWDTKNHVGSLGTLNAINDLANALKRNPKLKVMVNGGYFDLATPYFEAIYEMSQLPIPIQLHNNIQYSFYESGHMVYLHLPSLNLLSQNVRGFIKNCIE